ncbi:MAG: transposase [Thermomicrobiales bacterium]
MCLDETSRQPLGDARPPLPVLPGRLARQDPEYARGGVANCFPVTEPLRGWRDVPVSAQRTRLDFAGCVERLVADHYPEAERIVLVLDQLNTHSPASLRATFPPAGAKRLADRPTMEREITARAHRRNAAANRIDWQFTTADARIKLRRLYPAFED